MKRFKDYTVLHALLLGEGPHTRANPLVGTFQVDKGLIREAGVYFPRGCRGNIYVKLFFQEHQILPRNQEEWMHGEGGWWTGLTPITVDAAPLNIKVLAFQEAPAGGEICYDHTITVVVEIMPFEQVPRWDKLLMHWESLLEMLGVK